MWTLFRLITSSCSSSVMRLSYTYTHWTLGSPSCVKRKRLLLGINITFPSLTVYTRKRLLSTTRAIDRRKRRQSELSAVWSPSCCPEIEIERRGSNFEIWGNYRRMMDWFDSHFHQSSLDYLKSGHRIVSTAQCNTNQQRQIKTNPEDIKKRWNHDSQLNQWL